MEDVTLIGKDEPTIGHSSGVMTDIGLVIDAVIESEPALVGEPPLPGALGIAAALRQCNVTLSVEPAGPKPYGGPSFELSSQTLFAMVTNCPPDGRIAAVPVTATG